MAMYFDRQYFRVCLTVYIWDTVLFGDPLAPQNTAAALILLLIWFCCGVVLLVRSHTEPEAIQKPVVVVREQKKVTGVGMFLWLLGNISLFMAVAVISAVPVDGSAVFWQQQVFCHILWRLDAPGRAKSLYVYIPGYFHLVYQQLGQTEEI